MANDLMIDIAVTRVAIVTTVVNPLAPTAAEMAAGFDITPCLTSGTEIDFAEDDVISEMVWSDGQKSEAPSLGNYTVMINAMRKFTAGVPGTADPATACVQYSTIYVYKRTGLASSAAWAADQKADMFKVVVGRHQKPSGVGGYLKLKFKGLPAGLSGVATVAA